MPALLEKSTFGLDSDEIFDISDKILNLAIDGFSCLPDSFKNDAQVDEILSFYECFTVKRKTFADENLERFHIDKTSIS
jgi:glutamate--cysteine ligase